MLFRSFVLPDDVEALVPAVFAHRLGPARATSDAREERQWVTVALKRILAAVARPV